MRYLFSYTKSAYYRRVIYLLPLPPGASPASSTHQDDCLLSKADLVLFPIPRSGVPLYSHLILTTDD